MSQQSQPESGTEIKIIDGTKMHKQLFYAQRIAYNRSCRTFGERIIK